MKKRVLIFLCLCQVTFCVEVRNIAPPNMEPDAIGRKIVCFRPARKESPCFRCEKLNDKILIHNYGHGGAGWSLSMGSVLYCNDLFEKEAALFSKSTPIAVIGGGCIGLFTAYKLWNMGWKNITVYAESFDDLTSHHAGGLLSFRATYNDKAINDSIIEMGTLTYHHFKSIAEKTHPDFPSGASFIPTYFERLEESELEEFVGRGMDSAKEVLVNFGMGIQRSMVVYDDSLFIDTGSMMRQLKDYLHHKITFKIQRVQAFSQLEENVIFNCSGLGSQKLNHDKFLSPIQGHLVMLKNQDPEKLKYILIINSHTDSNPKSGRFRTIEFFPKQLDCLSPNDIGVLGGTFIENYDMHTSETETNSPSDFLNQVEFDMIINRAKTFFYGINL